MKMLLLDRVREVCREVAGRAEFVRIDRDRIESYAASITEEDLRPPDLDPGCHFLGRGDETAAFILTLASINFGSGYFSALKKIIKGSGYFTIAQALRKRFEKRGAFSVDELTRIDADDCAKVFKQDRHNPTIRELMKQFAMSLNELGRFLLERYDSSFVDLVASAEGSAEDLVEILASMSRFDDVAYYGDLDVAFYKRAQLAVADLWLAFGGEGPGRFDDLDRLTTFADNQVPHVLRIDGVLRYQGMLANAIDIGSFIPAQSPQEVEIRACAVHAVELLVEEMRRLGRSVKAMELDYHLWNKGLHPEYRSLPAHRTRTIFY